jgi:hypothetical protein
MSAPVRPREDRRVPTAMVLSVVGMAATNGRDSRPQLSALNDRVTSRTSESPRSASGRATTRRTCLRTTVAPSTVRPTRSIGVANRDLHPEEPDAQLRGDWRERRTRRQQHQRREAPAARPYLPIVVELPHCRCLSRSLCAEDRSGPREGTRESARQRLIVLTPREQTTPPALDVAPALSEGCRLQSAAVRACGMTPRCRPR